MSAAYLPIRLEHDIYPNRPNGPFAFDWKAPLIHFSEDQMWEPNAKVSVLQRHAGPVQADWERFWAECDRIGLWSLPPNFGARLFDGAHVKTRIRHAGRSIDVDAQLHEAPRDVVWTVILLHAALQALVGYGGPFPKPEDW